MPIFEKKRLANIVKTVTDLVNIAASGGNEAAYNLALVNVYEAVTPEKTIIITRGPIDSADNSPVIWCPDESWAREFVENARDLPAMRIWEVERGEAGAEDITDAFVQRWVDELEDYTVEEFDDFQANFPQGLIDLGDADALIEDRWQAHIGSPAP